jgi:hypothetical protein
LAGEGGAGAEVFGFLDAPGGVGAADPQADGEHVGPALRPDRLGGGQGLGVGEQVVFGGGHASAQAFEAR